VPSPSAEPSAGDGSDDDEAARAKALVAQAHRRLGGLTKGSALVLTPESLPGGVVFSCLKLKLAPADYGVKKLNEVPRLPRAVVVTRDRLLVLHVLRNSTSSSSPNSNSSNSSSLGGSPSSSTSTSSNSSSPSSSLGGRSSGQAAAAEAACPAPGSLEAAELAMADAHAKAQAAAAGGAARAEDGEDAALGPAAALVGCTCVVKSNHHLTEIVKMTLLKRVSGCGLVSWVCVRLSSLCRDKAPSLLVLARTFPEA
jgi:hypothetical protein